MSNTNKGNKKSFTLIQWNINGLKCHNNELTLLKCNYKPSIIALQETHLKPNEEFKLRGFKVIRKDHDNSSSNENARLGIALLIHLSIYSEEIILNTNLQAIAVKTTSAFMSHPITIANLYFHPDETPTKQEIIHLINQLPKPYIICGDLNAHSTTWGDNRICSKGKTMEKVLEEIPSIALLNNPTKKTFYSTAHQSFSAIDLTLASRSISSKIQWDTHDDLCGSDHFPVISIIENTKTLEYEEQDIWLYERADWVKYQSSISFHLELRSKIDQDTNINSLIEYINKDIIKAANAAIPKLKKT